ncbi:ATP-binding protein [Streptomyces sp. NPDC059783]|uniref:ATP-binding protein n=1 Tax=Streptomyces sp. NPDC059783 TaxID=3346944 RepID=UPI0036540A22
MDGAPGPARRCLPPGRAVPAVARHALPGGAALNPAWRNTTHDWAAAVDRDHLAGIRRDPAAFAPSGPGHLVLEVLAYAADEAECTGGGRARVTLYADGSVAVADDGRGTDTRRDADGRIVKKPVMATKDLRFFDTPGAQTLPDGHPRRGMSVVAALSEHLVHTNRRLGGAWTQRYAYGVPETGLDPVADDGTTGTLVHYRPAAPLRDAAGPTAADLADWTAGWPWLTVEVDDHRGPRTR